VGDRKSLPRLPEKHIINTQKLASASNTDVHLAGPRHLPFGCRRMSQGHRSGLSTLCVAGESSSPSDSPLQIPTCCIISPAPYYDIVAFLAYTHFKARYRLFHHITTTYHLYRGSITTMWYFYLMHIISARQFPSLLITTMYHICFFHYYNVVFLSYAHNIGTPTPQQPHHHNVSQASPSITTMWYF
jgi:hypothetical protein